MELKGRLRLIAEKVPSCRIVSDIGTDHAYIPIYLVQNDKCESAIASDVNKGPLVAAAANIEQAGFEDLIQTRLGNGIEPISINETDVVVIAGMGGALIKDILEREFEKAKKASALVLQPMNAIDELREWMYKNGFDIYDEALTQEGEKFYVVICARWTGCSRSLDELYYIIGEKIIENNDPLLKPYASRKLNQVEKVISEVENSKSNNEELQKRYEDLRSKFVNLINSID